MERTYTIKVEVVATFRRKVGIRGIAKEIAEGVRLPEPWKLSGVSSSSKARPERKEIVKEPTEEDMKVQQGLEILRTILADIRRIRPTGPKAHLELWPNRWCNPQYWDTRPDRNAHSHTCDVYVHPKGAPSGQPRKKVVRKALICINPKGVLHYLDPSIDHGNRTAVWLMAHEWTHKLRPRMQHSNPKFIAIVDDLVEKYAAMKAGTWSPPVHQPGWTRKVQEIAVIPSAPVGQP